MSKHTPGPWQIDWYICSEGGKELWRAPRSIGPACVDHNHWAGDHIDVDAADALLIAAAPDLLEALKLAWPIIEAEMHKQDCSYGKNFVQTKADRARNIYAKARAAIAKATGAPE